MEKESWVGEQALLIWIESSTESSGAVQKCKWKGCQEAFKLKINWKLFRFLSCWKFSLAEKTLRNKILFICESEWNYLKFMKSSFKRQGKLSTFKKTVRKGKKKLRHIIYVVPWNAIFWQEMYHNSCWEGNNWLYFGIFTETDF